MEFYVTAAPGTESVLRDELCDMGLRSARLNTGGIPFQGTFTDAYRVCLQSRIGQRVMLVLGRFDASSLEDIYNGAKRAQWERFATPDRTIACAAFAHPSCGQNPDYVALKLKDAIVDRQRSLFEGRRSDVNRDSPDVRAFVYWARNRATLYLDLSGEPLFKRGYRISGGEAPLKETLAAAILRLADWDGSSPLMDPMCGSGTLLIEGAMWAAGISPGIFRRCFGFERWACHDKEQQEIIRMLRGECRRGASMQLPRITGYDLDPQVLELAEQNASAAGLKGKLSFKEMALREHRGDGIRRLVVTNPPYGIRLDAEDRLFQELGTAVMRMSNCRVAILAGSPKCVHSIKLQPAAVFPLKNGGIDCNLTIYEVP